MLDDAAARPVMSSLNYAIFQLDEAKLLSDYFEEAKKFASEKTEENSLASENQIIMFIALSDILDIKEPTPLHILYLDKVVRESRIFTSADFADNPYYKNIDFSEKKQGDYQLCYDKYEPYEFSFYDVSKIIEGNEVPRICFFTDEFKYPAIRRISTGKTLMSVTPNEIFTMQKPIEKARKKVLTLGLGMGYYAYMASLKEDVESVTVIEKEQDVIDLFETNILPQFENKDKIRIIKADAIEYLNNVEDGEYDYCFADIWLGAYDMELYFAVKEIGRKFRKTKIDYWIEESFANQLISYVWIEMLNSFYRLHGMQNPELSEEIAKNRLETRKFNYVHCLLRKAEIKTPDDINFYMKPENIIRLINKTKIIF